MTAMHRPNRHAVWLIAALIASLAIGSVASVFASDELPSWKPCRAKTAILEFVARVTTQGGPDFVPPSERIATFDNDGTLWSEKPVYFQYEFALDHLKNLARGHRNSGHAEPFMASFSKDLKQLAENGEQGILQLVTATQAGTTTDEFDRSVREWLARARHPRFRRPYTDLVYQPMLELLAYLRANGFKTYIVSGGGVEFMRVWTEQVYGIPPEQVIGSSAKVKFELRDGKPVLRRTHEIDFVDNKAGKTVGIYKFIGRRPLAAFGNSDGDFEMLQWTTTGPGPRLGMIIHHTDGKREWAYDRHSFVGRLDKALDAAPKNRWIIVDMKTDWKVIYPFEK